MKSFAITALFLSSAVFALPHGVKRQDVPTTALAGAAPTRAADSTDNGVKVDTSPLNPDSSSNSGSGPGSGSESKSESGSGSESDNLAVDTAVINPTDSGNTPEVTGEPGDTDNGSALTVQTVTAATSSKTGAAGAVPTGTSNLESGSIGDSSESSGSDAVPPPSTVSTPNPGSGGACTPGKYQCNAGKTGWEVCDVLSTWVSGGECQSGTTCTFNEANGSPYCVAGAGALGTASNAPDPSSVAAPPVTPDSGSADTGSADTEPVDDTPASTGNNLPTPAANGSPSGSNDTSGAVGTDTTGSESPDTDTNGSESSNTDTSGSTPPGTDASGSTPPDTDTSGSKSPDTTGSKSVGAGAEPTPPLSSGSGSGSEMESNGAKKDATPTKVGVNVPTDSLTPGADDSSKSTETTQDRE